MSNLKVAVIHDWLVVNGGAEKVLSQILELYPEADIFTLVDFLPDSERRWLNSHKVNTSFIQRLPFAAKHYRNYFPLFSIAIEQFDMTGYDLIISSSYAVAKGVITGPDQLHVCYCHSPARYAWDLQADYLRESNMERGLKSMVARYFLHKFRIWDVRASNGVDRYIANSEFIKRRIYKCYRRDADVIYPPVDITRFSVSEEKEDFYLAASRLVPYKRIDLIAEAFSKMPDKKLRIIGTGPDSEKVSAIAAKNENIEYMGYQNDETLIKQMQTAKAFVFAAEEDFGIIPVEAQACGTPVIAYGKGGCLETVIDGVSGVHFNEQSVDSLSRAINYFESVKAGMSFELICKNAERFSSARFKEEIKSLIKKEIEKG